MTTSLAQLIPIELLPGVQPSTDRSPFSTKHAVFADKVRWYQGVPQKIGGWVSQAFSYGATILGVCRSIFSSVVAAELYTLLGTHETLYALIGSALTNITPLNTSTTTIANSLASDYRTLGSNPLATQIGTGNITVTDSDAANYQAGDAITLSGVTGTVNGISSSVINGSQVIRSLASGSYTIAVAGTATGTGSGGGGSVVVATGLVTVSATANGISNGQRVKLSGASAFAGLSTGNINAEFIARNVSTNAFGVMTAGTATSSVTGGGGSGTAYQTQLAAGAKDANAAQGYGAGNYGVGLYGTALVSSNDINFPRIWFFDRFEGDIIMTPGNQGPLYVWEPSTSVAPSQLSNAPTTINYAFVSNDIIVTFGYDDVENQIFSCDQFNSTNWTASETNQVFQEVVTGADRLISHASLLGTNLVFTQNRTYTMTYIGLPLVWDIQLLDGSIGLIAPMARCVALGVAYWMGQKNFYMWAGGNIQVIPSADQFVSTILNYVYNNLSDAQRSKIFCWFNRQFNEIWFHYPSASSDEPDRVARFNVLEQHWVPDTFDRTASEYPDQLAGSPRLISAESILYSHENGTDADGEPMTFQLTTNLRGGGRKNTFVSSFAPDSIQTGNISVTLSAQAFQQSAAETTSQTVTVTPTTEFVPVQVQGRFWQYDIQGSELGQSWLCGEWMEFVQEGAPQ